MLVRIAFARESIQTDVDFQREYLKVSEGCEVVMSLSDGRQRLVGSDETQS